MAHPSGSKARLIFVITGANSGVGFGICKRLLFQLSLPDIPDSRAQHSITSNDEASPYLGACELTIVMACRSQRRAMDARRELLRMLDVEIARRQQRDPKLGEYGRMFRATLHLDYVHVDLTSVASMFAFCNTISQRYPYITHLVLNAGMGYFTGVAWLRVVTQFVCQGYRAFYRPRFKIQDVSPQTSEGLGTVWCANVFSSYVLVTRLRPLLRDAPYADARVLWMSSIEAEREVCPADLMENYQLLNTRLSYEISKYQLSLLAPEMNQREQERRGKERTTRPQSEVQHILVHPGITSSNIYAVIGYVLLRAMELAFLLSRWAGSPHHVLSSYKGALPTVHIALTGKSNIPSSKQPVQFGARCNRLGREYVGCDEVEDWEGSKHVGPLLANKCEAIYDSFCELLDPAGKARANGNGYANGHANGHGDPKQLV